MTSRTSGIRKSFQYISVLKRLQQIVSIETIFVISEYRNQMQTRVDTEIIDLF